MIGNQIENAHKSATLRRVVTMKFPQRISLPSSRQMLLMVKGNGVLGSPGISVAKRQETTVQERTALKLIVAMAGVILALAAIIPSTGIRPYGEQALLAQIDIDNAALCGKFGFLGATPQFADCMDDLIDLRRRHAELLADNSWP